jgi:hypothetical protein
MEKILELVGARHRRSENIALQRVDAGREGRN